MLAAGQQHLEATLFLGCRVLFLELQGGGCAQLQQALDGGWRGVDPHAAPSAGRQREPRGLRQEGRRFRGAVLAGPL
jgi:hypothetical protein